MKLRPVGNRLIVKRLEAETVTPSGLIIPDAAKKKEERAEVLAVSDDVKIKIKIGDVVYMDKYSGQEVCIEDVTYIILSADNILAILLK